MRWKLFVTLLNTVWNRTFWSRYKRVLQLPLWKFVEVFVAVSSWCTALHIVQHGSMQNADWFDKIQDCIRSQIATSLKPPIPPLESPETKPTIQHYSGCMWMMFENVSSANKCWILFQTPCFTFISCQNWRRHSCDLSFTFWEQAHGFSMKSWAG